VQAIGLIGATATANASVALRYMTVFAVLLAGLIATGTKFIRHWRGYTVGE